MSSYPKCKVLIDVFSNNSYIPNVITELILEYHGFPQLFILYDLNLFILNSKSIYNIITKKTKQLQTKERLKYRPNQYIINNVSLPKYVFKTTLHSHTSNQYSTKQCPWSMVVQIGHDEYGSYSLRRSDSFVNAYHLPLPTRINHELFNLEYSAFDFKLPPFPVDNMFKPPSLVYKKTEHILYALNINGWNDGSNLKHFTHSSDIMLHLADCSKSVFSLNFDVCIM